MDIPFSLAVSNTNPYGILWNPWGTVVSTSVDNTVLTDMTADTQEAYGLLVPRRGGWIQGFVVVSDTADAKVTIGVWDTVLNAFVGLYPIHATIVAGAGVANASLDTGVPFPLSATRIPCIKYTPVSGSAVITGHINMTWEIPDAANATGVGPTIPTQFIQDEQALANITDEQNDLPLRNEP